MTTRLWRRFRGWMVKKLWNLDRVLGPRLESLVSFTRTAHGDTK